MNKYKNKNDGIIVLSLFDGISCGYVALKEAGIKIKKYYASEIDKYAISISKYNYKNIIHLGDINNFKNWNIEVPDIIIGGSPCQDLSILKRGKGLDGDKSNLIYKFIQILNFYKPNNFLLENVIPRKKEWKEKIDKLIGVRGVLINSDIFTQQNRPRYYWTNIKISEFPKRPEWNYKYYQYRRTYFRENKSGVCPCLTANMGTGGHNVPLKSMDLKDKLSPEDCEELQTLPKNYTKFGIDKNNNIVKISKTQRYRTIGNCWTIKVVKHIFKGLF